MPILNKTSIVGRVEALLTCENSRQDLSSNRVESVEVTYGGIRGDSHYGLTRASCNRVRQQYTPGTRIRNTRQISILSQEELCDIAGKMDIPELLPEWVGANISLSGIPLLTQLPPSSRLIFDNGVALVVDMENGPCRYPGDVIEKHHPGKGRLFPSAAMGKRGLTAWVERQGSISAGEQVSLHIPPQRIYSI